MRLNKTVANNELKSSLKDAPSTISSLDHNDLGQRFRDNIMLLENGKENELVHEELYPNCPLTPSRIWEAQYQIADKYKFRNNQPLQQTDFEQWHLPISTDDRDGSQSYTDLAFYEINKNYVQSFYEGLNHDWMLAVNIMRLLRGVDSEWIVEKENGNSETVLQEELPGCWVIRFSLFCLMLHFYFPLAVLSVQGD